MNLVLKELTEMPSYTCNKAGQIPMRFATSLRTPIALLVFALALRLGYLALVWTGPLGNADSAAYKALAVSLSHGGPYEAQEGAGPGGFPTDLQRPPGYPAFLAVVNAHGVVSNYRTSVIQCVAGAVFVALLTFLCSLITDSSVGVLAGLFYATDWITIVHTPMVIAETIYCITLGLAILVYILALEKRRASLLLLAGLFLGISALIKPAAQLVLFAFVVGWIFQRNRSWKGLLFLVTYLACVAPWMARNEIKYGVPTLSEIGTADLYFYTAQGSLHVYPISDVAGNQITNDVNRLDKEWRAQALSVPQRSTQMRHDALRLMANHWPAVLQQAAIGFARTCVGTGFVTVSDSMGKPPGSIPRLLLAVLPMAQVILLWAIAIYGFFSPAVLSRGVRFFLAASILCVLLPSAAPLAQSRFRAPAVPALSVLAATGVIQLRVRSLRRQPIDGVSA
jgi:4-amino-4-deoxy-L-arabinose transferase-like glycosyltransferase